MVAQAQQADQVLKVPGEDSVSVPVPSRCAMAVPEPALVSEHAELAPVPVHSEQNLSGSTPGCKLQNLSRQNWN